MTSFLTYTLFILCTSLCKPQFMIKVNSSFVKDISESIQLTRISKTSHLHFYFHDQLSGKNSTVTKIAGPPDKKFFGTTSMADDLLTEGPEMTSKPIGKAQGIYAVASQNDISFLMLMNFVFVEGVYNGSTISVHGRNRVSDNVREMPVVGGTGIFRFARGYALAHTVWFDYKTGDATVEYNVYVSHN